MMRAKQGDPAMAPCVTSIISSMRTIALTGLAALAATGAVAQGTPRDEREPNPAVVRPAERAAGDAPSASQQRQEQQTTDQIYRELTGQNPNATPNVPPAGPTGNPAQNTRETERLYRELTGQNPTTTPR